MPTTPKFTCITSLFSEFLNLKDIHNLNMPQTELLVSLAVQSSLNVSAEGRSTLPVTQLSGYRSGLQHLSPA